MKITRCWARLILQKRNRQFLVNFDRRLRVRNPTLQLFFSCYSQCWSLCSVSRLVSVKKVVVSLDWSMRTLTINYDLGDSFLAYEVASWESSATAGHCSILYLGPADFLLLSMSRIMINDLLLLQLGWTCQTPWWTWITSIFGPKSLLNDNLIEKAFNKVKLYFFYNTTEITEIRTSIREYFHIFCSDLWNKNVILIT